MNKENAKRRVSFYKEQLRQLKNKEFSLKKIIFLDKSGAEASNSSRSEYYQKGVKTRSAEKESL